MEGHTTKMTRYLIKMSLCILPFNGMIGNSYERKWDWNDLVAVKIYLRQKLLELQE